MNHKEIQIPSNKYGTSLDLLSLGLTASENVDGDLTNSITVNISDTTTQ